VKLKCLKPNSYKQQTYIAVAVEIANEFPSLSNVTIFHMQKL